MNATKQNQHARAIRAKFFPTMRPQPVLIPPKPEPHKIEARRVYPVPIGPLPKPVRRTVNGGSLRGIGMSQAEMRRRADAIVATQSAFYGVGPQDVRRRTRKQQVVFARQACVFHLRAELDLSWGSIAAVLGGAWDHTTMLHAYRAHCERVTLGEAADVHTKPRPARLSSTAKAARDRKGVEL